MVGRPRKFDEDQVLDAAMEAFWARGYEATSMADLMATTGLHKGSLYQAFGDKHALFLSALRRYLQNMRQQKNALLNSADTPLGGLKAVVHGMVDIVDGESPCPKGCMAVNALVELAPHDPEVQKIMVDHMQIMRGSMEDVVRRAQTAGEVGKDRPPEVITSLIMTFMAGLGAQLKGPMTKAQAHDLLDAQLDALL